MTGAIKAYSALESAGIHNTKVRLRNMYFGLQDGSNILKIIDEKLFPDDTNRSAVRKGENVDDIFLAPEDLKTLKYPTESYNTLSGVFSLGVSIMQLCLLTSSRELYDYEKLQLNYNEL